MRNSELSGMRVTIMGLGLHGGGVASARYCADRGATVTVTDLRGEEVLRESVEALGSYPIRFVLGKHEERDFDRSDMVIKNPAVRRDVSLLTRSPRIETDISLFLAEVSNPIVAITGTKGKSSTASAAHHILKAYHPGAKLGGNITYSPLSFVEELAADSPVVLELSSFQLGDLAFVAYHNALHGSRPTEFSPIHQPIDPTVAVITNIYRDHMDYYGNMEPYVADKKVIYRTQTGPWSLFSATDGHGLDFAQEAPSRSLLVSADESDMGREGLFERNGWGILSMGKERVPLVPPELRVPGAHQRSNLLTAAGAAYVAGAPAELVKARVAGFPGIPHRLAYVGSIGATRVYNDSASTIPEAARAAVNSFKAPVHLICGGTDKGLDLEPLADAAATAKSVHLIAGGATDRLVPLLRRREIPYSGPYRELSRLLPAAVQQLNGEEGKAVLLFSPGCSSFELFDNEFHRGNQFVAALNELGVSS